MLKKVTFFSGSLKLGGPQRVMVILANKLLSDGIEVTFVTTITNEVELPLDPRVKHIKITETSQFRIIKTLQKLCWIRKVLKKDDSDVIVSFWHNVNMYLMISSIFLHKQIILSERNDPRREPDNAFLRIIRSFLYQFADYVVFQTKEAQEYYSKTIQNKSKIIVNPIRDDLPDRYIGVRRKEIVNFCRLSPQKNLFMLINAFAILAKEYPDYCLTIYGRGPLEEELIRYIQKLGLSDSIVIKDYEIDIHNKIKDCAMFVSSSDFEGISNSMLEALAIGIPTICTDCPSGGARIVIKSYNNGILIPVGDTQALYEAMKYIIEHPSDAEQMSENAVKIKEDLTTDNIYLEWLQVLQDLNKNRIKVKERETSDYET